MGFLGEAAIFLAASVIAVPLFRMLKLFQYLSVIPMLTVIRLLGAGAQSPTGAIPGSAR